MSNVEGIIFKALHIVAWLIFVGLSIEAGGFLVNFFFSIFKPEFIDRLYQKLDLTAVYRTSKMAFFGVYSFILSVSILKAYLFYVVIRLMMKMDLNAPFSAYVSGQIARIGYLTIAIGFIGLIATQFTKNVWHHGVDTEVLFEFWSDSSAFLLMGAVIYIIAVIFKRGVAIQQENDLTV